MRLFPLIVCTAREKSHSRKPCRAGGSQSKDQLGLVACRGRAQSPAAQNVSPEFGSPIWPATRLPTWTQPKDKYRHTLLLDVDNYVKLWGFAWQRRVCPRCMQIGQCGLERTPRRCGFAWQRRVHSRCSWPGGVLELASRCLEQVLSRRRRAVMPRTSGSTAWR